MCVVCALTAHLCWLAVVQYVLFGSGVAASSPLQGTAFYQSSLPKHADDAAPDAPDTQIHYAPNLADQVFLTAVGAQEGEVTW